MAASAFSTFLVNYFEDRSDGVNDQGQSYAWNVAYDLGFDGRDFQVDLRVDLVGDNPGTLANTWLDGANRIWNDNVVFGDGKWLYEVKFDLAWVNSGAHQTVTVHDTLGRANMITWYTSSNWGPSYDDEIAAHEIGHMLGNFDEYVGGATYNGYTTTNTLMSDNSPIGMENYYWGIQYFAEQNADATLDTVTIRFGSNFIDLLIGTDAQNAIYGRDGGDTINGRGGGDLLKGEAGRDTLYGGKGNDVLYGNSHNDKLSGGKFSDLLFGGRGKDKLEGGKGNDTLKGGDGDDTFIFQRGFGKDTIKDFSTGHEYIVFDFEDSATWADPYGSNNELTGMYGLQVSNVLVLDPIRFGYEGTGYNTGRISGDWVAYNAFGEKATIRGEDFDLEHAYLTAAWADDLKVKIKAYDDGLLVGSVTVRLNTSGPIGFSFDDTIFDSVDRVVFISSSASDPDNAHFVVDDVEIGISDGGEQDRLKMDGYTDRQILRAIGSATNTSDGVRLDFGDGDRITLAGLNANDLSLDMFV